MILRLLLDQLKCNILKECQFKSLQNLNYHLNRIIDFANSSNNSIQNKRSTDPYAWLERNDPCWYLTDEEILEKTIDLSDSCLTSRETKWLMAMIKRYKKAFSLRDKIGECPNITLNIDAMFIHTVCMCRIR